MDMAQCAVDMLNEVTASETVFEEQPAGEYFSTIDVTPSLVPESSDPRVADKDWSK